MFNVKNGRGLKALVLAFTCSWAVQAAAADFSHEGPLLLRDIKLIDGLGNPPKAGQSVYINQGRIETISKQIKAADLPANTKIIDGQGLAVMPGLIDLHVHLEMDHQGEARDPQRIRDISLPALLYAGVTTVHDMGVSPSNADWIYALRDQVNKGEVLGPRISSVGATIERLESVQKNVFELTAATTKAEIKQILDERQANGINLIKLYAGLSPWSARHIMVEAKKRGMRSVADFWCGNLSQDLLEITLVDGYAHGGCKVIEPSVAKWMKANDKFVLMTLTIFDTMGGHRARKERENKEFANNPLMVDVEGKAVVDNYHNHFVDIRELVFEGEDSLYQAQHFGDMTHLLSTNQRNLVLLNDAGVLLGMGTDSPFPPSSWFGEAMHWEMELHAQAGIEPVQVIKMATHNNARILQRDQEFGSIEAGKVADLLIVHGDPSRNMADTRNVRYVIKEGKLIDREAMKKKP